MFVRCVCGRYYISLQRGGGKRKRERDEIGRANSESREIFLEGLGEGGKVIMTYGETRENSNNSKDTRILGSGTIMSMYILSV